MMIRQLLCVSALMLSATVLRADVFYFSYTGTSPAGKAVSAAGTLLADKFGDLGLYKITDITGNRNGNSISDNPGGGIFYWGSGAPPLSLGAISFSVNVVGGGQSTVFYAGNAYLESYKNAKGSTTTTSLSKFYIGTNVPEPSVLVLLFSVGLGLWVLARKLPLKNTPPR